MNFQLPKLVNLSSNLLDERLLDLKYFYLFFRSVINLFSKNKNHRLCNLENIFSSELEKTRRYIILGARKNATSEIVSASDHSIVGCV